MDFTQGSLHQYLGTLWRTILSKPKILHQYFGALLRTILSKPKVLHQHLGALLRTVPSRIQTPCSIWMLVHQNCAKGVTKGNISSSQCIFLWFRTVTNHQGIFCVHQRHRTHFALVSFTPTQPPPMMMWGCRLQCFHWMRISAQIWRKPHDSQSPQACPSLSPEWSGCQLWPHSVDQSALFNRLFFEMLLLEKPPLLFHYGGIQKAEHKHQGSPNQKVLGRADTGSQDKTLVFNKDKKH